MTHKTKGIVLRTVKYGETSLVVTILTELFGVQTYMVNGVRSSKKTAKANLFQPGAILELVVYHYEQKNMQRIKEFGWSVVYENVLTDVIKNSIALYIVELIQKCLKQPEKNEDLFYFVEDILVHLDKAERQVAANIPLYFALHLPYFLGFRINDDYDETQNVLDLQEGSFVNEQPAHTHFIDGENAMLTSQILRVMQPGELAHFSLRHNVRRKLLYVYHDYYALHIHDFGQMKTLAVLQDVL